MANKIAVVNKQLHTKLFQEQAEEIQQQQDKKKNKKNNIPPHILLKTMIKKGLTNTQNQTFSRPKTANSNYRPNKDKYQSIDKFKSIEIQDKKKKQYEAIADTTIEFESSKTPKQFYQFDKMIKQIFEIKNRQDERKKVKLQKYSVKKFNYMNNKGF